MLVQTNKKTLKLLEYVYKKILKNGVFLASSIMVAEAAKVIENTQRDLNIALMNELSIICSKLNIETREVIDAASTKWNFHKYSPGLVGGHCIGVDPYYLTHKAKLLGYNPKIILAGRKLNDGMPNYVIDQVMNIMSEKKIFKVETKEAIKNLKKIIKFGNNLLIDRGDLSKDIKIENVPIVQRKIIHEANKSKKNVYVATNFLESMILNSYPTRAEVNDIYNTIEMGAKGLVLAAETAIGKNPVECVKILKKIIKVFKKNNA